MGQICFLWLLHRLCKQSLIGVNKAPEIFSKHFPLCFTDFFISARADKKQYVKVHYSCQISPKVSYRKLSNQVQTSCEVLMYAVSTSIMPKINMDHKTFNALFSDWFIYLFIYSVTQVIVIQTPPQSCSNQFPASKKISVHFCKVVFISNNND